MTPGVGTVDLSSLRPIAYPRENYAVEVTGVGFKS
jgi:hypothetical protein